jgi:hypothetical protein
VAVHRGDTDRVTGDELLDYVLAALLAPGPYFLVTVHRSCLVRGWPEP